MPLSQVKLRQYMTFAKLPTYSLLDPVVDRSKIGQVESIEKSSTSDQVDRVESIFSLIKSIDLPTTNRVKKFFLKLAYLCAESAKWPDGRNDGHSMSVISSICRSGYFQLRQQRPVARPDLSQPTQPKRLCMLSLHKVK